MSGDLDKSLLDRLAALRGSGTAPESVAPTKFSVDVIERAKTPTREDALAARLKSLRDKDESSSAPATPEQSTKAGASTSSNQQNDTPKKSNKASVGSAEKPGQAEDDDVDVDAAFATDDQTLEELLGDIGADEQFSAEPDDDKVKALLEELSKAVPKDSAPDARGTREEKKDDSDDDSDGEKMTNEVEDVIARLRDEMEVEAALGKNESEDESDHGDKKSKAEDDRQHHQSKDGDGEDDGDMALPSVPTNLGDLPLPPGNAPASKPDMDDITARMNALRASSDSPSVSFPSVPTGRPAPGDKPVNRLKSTTKYTDDDVDSWCTVCLEDATLRCLGCDDDPYCVRCWHEMHVGPAAAFDDRTHKAVQFSRDNKKKAEKKKVAIGA